MDHILNTYYLVTQDYSKRFHDHFAQFKLTVPQAFALSMIAAESPMPISVLSEKSGISGTAVSGIICRLEGLGLIRKVRDAEKRRTINLEITEEYHKLREQTDLDMADYFDSLLAPLSPEERATVAEGLKLLERALREAPADQD